MRTDVLGVGFDDLTMDEAVGRAAVLLESGTPAYIVTPNPEIVWLCRDDPELKEIVGRAALVLPDGIGVVYGAKILGRPLKGKIAGIDFAEKLLERMAGTGKSVYLLGAKPGVASMAAKKLQNKYPGLVVAGTADGYFKDDGPVIEKINASKPDLLLVCLGAPKQERWMAANATRLNVRLMAGLGGALDVFAGTAERAPESWQRLHLEWLHRLKKEPWRWRRMIKLPLFIFAVAGQRLKGN
ncbi:N-acetylglucosaminyldiphosphoundecaprenol N-acetyl-beta-D-mannosaminyltransferase [Sporobacter termitidis DSM 10068]|uniref:N-acetylglucosaminyldiphosphoundecaprenol N-acetyl-beta-D-mannosaminyltransferase n=1 Tax=Sporobacter termitidis DSM 10068 TaxID=1123282 RepID=A0A1M5YN35_9FIRM|nr:WecB/TagA/CpsF family glycosyltransferase [Sporobacter termitidis]SHI13234.1 N-acetylglucosaminyldiphosphoundecaprenol N-acetyl-beta-D-mannosaminyltransferase [Sporobacter termitidis DSM 10068]